MSSKFSKKLATFRIFSPRDAIEVNSEKTKRKILENNEYLVPRPFTSQSNGQIDTPPKREEKLESKIERGVFQKSLPTLNICGNNYI